MSFGENRCWDLVISKKCRFLSFAVIIVGINAAPTTPLVTLAMKERRELLLVLFDIMNFILFLLQFNKVVLQGKNEPYKSALRRSLKR
jgi:hypothetical protein